MTQEQIIEGNMAIAEFMGENPQIYKDKGLWIKNLAVKANYDESWDMLMPVVEKITTFRFTNESWAAAEQYEDYAWPRTFGMRDENGRYMVRFNANALHIADTLIEAAWLAVVDFIHWHNDQPQEEQITFKS